MVDATRATLRFFIEPTTIGPSIKLTAHVPHHLGGPINGTSDLLGLAAVMLRYRIEAIRDRSVTRVSIDKANFGFDKAEIFASAWHILRNSMLTVPKIAVGKHLVAIDGWAPRRIGDRRFIEIDTRLLPDGNITFRVTDRSGQYHEIDSEGGMLSLFDWLVGRIGVSEFNAAAFGSKGANSYETEFKFGNRSTKTYVVERFRDGLPRENFRSVVTGAQYRVPPTIETLVDRAQAVLTKNAVGIKHVRDHAMFAPLNLRTSMDFDSDDATVTIELSESSYRYYGAFAFAERLAAERPEFEPLLAFVRDTPDGTQPSNASCSIGVRVVLETSDGKFIVAHRSNAVKMNPDVWSVSANEGVRTALLTKGRSSVDLLPRAADYAVKNELRINVEEISSSKLVSLCRNSFNQWGAGFWMQTELSSDTVIRRQAAAMHGFENRRVAVLPIEVRACGNTMRELGSRWYGGALETICTVISSRELADGRFVSPEEIGSALSDASGQGIIPVDEPNVSMYRDLADSGNPEESHRKANAT